MAKLSGGNSESLGLAPKDAWSYCLRYWFNYGEWTSDTTSTTSSDDLIHICLSKHAQRSKFQALLCVIGQEYYCMWNFDKKSLLVTWLVQQ